MKDLEEEGRQRSVFKKSNIMRNVKAPIGGSIKVVVFVFRAIANKNIHHRTRRNFSPFNGGQKQKANIAKVTKMAIRWGTRAHKK